MVWPIDRRLIRSTGKVFNSNITAAIKSPSGDFDIYKKNTKLGPCLNVT